MCFHVCHQLELSAGTVQILIIPVCAEVSIAYQIVSEEADTAFQSNDLGAQGQKLLFQCGQAGTGGQEAFGVGFKQLQAHLHLGKVLFILCCGGGTETDALFYMSRVFKTDLKVSNNRKSPRKTKAIFR